MNQEWKLVPVEPTKEMMLNGSACQHHDHDDLSCIQRDMRRGIWDKMIAAAPAKPAGEVEVLAIVTLGSFSAEELGEIDVEPQMSALERIQQQVVTNEDVALELVDFAHLTRLQAENAALQQRLTVADEQVDILSGGLRLMTSFGSGTNIAGVKTVAKQTLNRAAGVVSKPDTATPQ